MGGKLREFLTLYEVRDLNPITSHCFAFDDDFHEIVGRMPSYTVLQRAPLGEDLYLNIWDENV